MANPAPQVNIPRVNIPSQSLKAFVNRALVLLSKRNTESSKRMRCMLGKILNFKVDARYIDTSTQALYQPKANEKPRQEYPSPDKLRLPDVKKQMEDYAKSYAKRPDDQLVKALEEYEKIAVYQPYAIINHHISTQGGCADPGMRILNEWMRNRQQDSNSIYSCYK